MRIFFVGVFKEPNSTSIQMAKNFKKHKVTCFDFRYKKLNINHPSEQKLQKRNQNIQNLKESKSLINNLKLTIYLRFYKRIIDRIGKSKISFFKKISLLNKFFLFGNWKISRQILNEVRNNKYDLVLLAKINNINYNLIKKLNKHTKTWYFFMDPLEAALHMDAHKYAALSTWSSATFSSVNAFFKRAGANSYHITEGINTDLFKLTKKEIKKKYDVIFIGSASTKRKKFINFLENNNINVVCYGQGWKKHPVQINKIKDKYNNTKIILNFTRGNIGFSDRVFQVLGTRSFLISEYCKDLEKFFKKGVHLEWFNTPEELLELIQFYLKNDVLRENIAQNGYEFVTKNFTWENTIQKIFQVITNQNYC